MCTSSPYYGSKSSWWNNRGALALAVCSKRLCPHAHVSRRVPRAIDSDVLPCLSLVLAFFKQRRVYYDMCTDPYHNYAHIFMVVLPRPFNFAFFLSAAPSLDRDVTQIGVTRQALLPPPRYRRTCLCFCRENIPAISSLVSLHRIVYTYVCHVIHGTRDQVLYSKYY